MIVKLKGFIEDWFEDFVDLDVKGVVYRIFVPKKNINKISEKGSLVTFFIFEILKESERLFFGFSNKNDRELFSDLLKVQGVGGKMALNIMSSLDSEVIQDSIITKNQEVFSSVSGVGSKLAVRIVNELCEKLKKKEESAKVISNFSKTIFNDLVSCLSNLGYSQNICEKTAFEVISKNKKMNLEKLIPVALNYLSRPNLSKNE